MTGHDDDLAPWLDDPVVQALRGPGTSEELSGEAQYLAAFRAAQPTPPTSISSGRGRLRRVGRRLGGGGTAVVITVALGAGAAAAAYTQNLPDPVQRAVHGVLGPVGVPGPATQSPDKTSEAERSPVPTNDPSNPTGSPSQSPTDEPTDEPTDDPSSGPTDSPSESPTESPTDSPTETPTESPTESPTSSPTVTPTVPATAVVVSGPTHRAAPDEQVPLSGTVTAADGSPVAGQLVSLLQRLGKAWQPVASAASDETGAVSLATPVLSRTSVFRLAVGDDLSSQEWRIVLVPTVDLVALPGGGATGIVVTARGGLPGDRVSLLSRKPGQDVLVGRARLSDELSATFQIASPSKAVTFVAQLPRSRAHASARQALRIQPLKPVAVTATAPVDTLGPRDSVTVTGTVSGTEGTVLPGRTVSLLLREPGGDWRRVGSAISDSAGSVSIAVGPIAQNVAVRLRAGKVRSPAVHLRLQPEWSSSVSSGATGAAMISGTALGGAPGDSVLLRKVVAGRLTTVQQAILGPDGTVRFDVALPARGRDRYRLVLARTPMHLRAMTAVVVDAPP